MTSRISTAAREKALRERLDGLHSEFLTTQVKEHYVLDWCILHGETRVIQPKERKP